ncbi:MAG: histidine kinase dimerization/phosphoacceptor domain -containing protein [Hyphomonadaceae bacterium]|nr:histidine kinase dimerization/phosphoacceptor domain -containing protein [Hyphomonadaceae bacterium]
MAPNDDELPQGPDHLSETPHLASALESDRFKQFLDHMPFAVAVSQLGPVETITYANLGFERLIGKPAGSILGQTWRILPGTATGAGSEQPLQEAVVGEEDYLGVFRIEKEPQPVSVDAWSNIILSDAGNPTYRLVALADVRERSPTDQEKLAEQLLAKDILLRELQHRVKNNLQMITALIRIEARNLRGNPAKEPFDRLAGRIESLSLLYRSMAESRVDDSIDLGVYLSQIASSVMLAHAVEGIRLDLKVDTWPVSINVAMPTGLVVNELLTNSLKHAFTSREGGTITLHSLVDETGCRVIVADDGVGLQADAVWPVPGKMTALIVQSLKQNAGAELSIQSKPDGGMRATIIFSRADAAPENADPAA